MNNSSYFISISYDLIKIFISYLDNSDFQTFSFYYSQIVYDLVKIINRIKFSHFDNLSLDIIEIVISRLSNKDVHSFIYFYNVKDNLNWNKVFLLKYDEENYKMDYKMDYKVYIFMIKILEKIMN